MMDIIYGLLLLVLFFLKKETCIRFLYFLVKRDLHLYICTSEIRAFTYFCKGVVWLHCVTPNKLEMCLLWSSMRSVLVLSYHKTGSKATNRHCAATGGGAALASPGLVEPLVLAVPRSGSREADFGLITLAAPG